MNFYFTIYSDSSRYGYRGLRPKVNIISEKDIIDTATEELNHSGESFENLAGIDFIENAEENLIPTRQLSNNEIFVLSIQKLNDDGRLFEIFLNEQEFIKEAENYNLEDEALNIIKKYGGLL